MFFLGKIKKSIYFFSILLVFFFLPLSSFAVEDALIGEGENPGNPVNPTSNTLSETEPDAIAIRIIPNPENYNIQQWYKMQGFVGSPQSLIVDGYKAIRDGRTVYISAANIDLDSKKIYFNIYLISYNQEADDNTLDIFGKILSNWKLNTNLKERVGRCNISSKICKTNADCPAKYICGGQTVASDSSHLEDENEINSVGAIYQKNRCIIAEENYNQDLVNTPACLLDSDCPSGLFCDSPKSMLIRDMERLEKIKAIKLKLEAYKNLNGKYPTVSSGTYIPHLAISSWPSWQQTFLSQISASGLSDSINRISSCFDEKADFDLLTCWEPNKAVFLSTKEPVNALNFALPEYSSVFAYVGDKDGQTASLYSSMESGNYWGEDLILPSGESLNDYNPPYVPIGDELPQYNNPYFEEASLAGHSGTAFEGYIRAKDPRGQALTWTVSNCVPGKPLYPSGTIVGGCGDWSSWTPSKFPGKEATNSNERILLKATRTGQTDSINSSTVQEKNKRYIVGVSVKNSSGYETIMNFPIYIYNQNPSIQLSSAYSQNLSNLQDFSFPISISDRSKLSSLSVCYLNSSNICERTWNIPTNTNRTVEFDGSTLFNNKLKMDFAVLGENQDNYSLDIKNKFPINTPGIFNASHLGTHRFRITASDAYQAQTSKDFTITFTADSPSILFKNCSSSVALNTNYTCEISSSRPNENITAQILEKPSFLNFNASTKVLSGSATPMGPKVIKAKITNDFNLSSEGTHNFSVFNKADMETVSHTDITSNSFKCNGRIISANGNYTGGRGCVANVSSSNLNVATPTSCNGSNSCSYEAFMADNSSYTHTISGLTRNTTYYYRAYGINEAGISYGANKSFKTRADYPVLSTSPQTLLSGNVVLSGNLSDHGGGDLYSGSNILAMGFVWSSSSSNVDSYIASCSLNSNNCVFASAPYNVGSFSSLVSANKFTPGTTYYFKAFAVNQDYVGQRVGLSDIRSFTLPIAPTISTTNVSNITPNSALSGGSISNPGALTISECGVIYWSNDSNHLFPETKIVSPACLNSFNSNIINLNPNVNYTVKAYLNSSMGTVYGNALPFKTNSVVTASYYSGGATSGSTPGTQSVAAGTNITIPNQGTLLKTGHVFSGWIAVSSFGEDSTYQAGSVITLNGNMDFFAQWTPSTYTLSFDSQGGTAVSSKTVTYGQAIGTLNTPTRTGYTFSGWKIGASSISTATTWNYTSNQTAVAQWSTNAYNIIFDKNDSAASGTMNVQSIGSGLSANLNANTFVKTGNIFSGWATTPTGSVSYANGASYTMGTSNVTLYAKWTPSTYTLSFDSQGGTAVSSKTVTYGQAIGTLNTPTRTGYTFSGWKIGASSISAATIWSYTSNQTAVAQWTANASSYNLNIRKYNDNQGSVISEVPSTDGLFLNCGTSCTTPVTIPYQANSTVTLIANPITGYTAVWTGCSSVFGDSCDVLMSSNKNVSVSFQQVATYSLNVNLNFGLGSSGSVSSFSPNFFCSSVSGCTYNITEGTNITLSANASNIPNNQFLGWTGSCSGVSTTCSFNMNSNKTVGAAFGCVEGGGGTACMMDAFQ